MPGDRLVQCDGCLLDVKAERRKPSIRPDVVHGRSGGDRDRPLDPPGGGKEGRCEPKRVMRNFLVIPHGGTGPYGSVNPSGVGSFRPGDRRIGRRHAARRRADKSPPGEELNHDCGPEGPAGESWQRWGQTANTYRRGIPGGLPLLPWENALYSYLYVQCGDYDGSDDSHIRW
jgi:hypothetical protein